MSASVSLESLGPGLTVDLALTLKETGTLNLGLLQRCCKAPPSRLDTGVLAGHNLEGPLRVSVLSIAC